MKADVCVGVLRSGKEEKGNYVGNDKQVPKLV
jgi:hypothetical protein